MHDTYLLTYWDHGVGELILRFVV